jgi:hypothetical protein
VFGGEPGQIMGENFERAAFDHIEGVVVAMIPGEDAQLSAMPAFLKTSNLHRAVLDLFFWDRVRDKPKSVFHFQPPVPDF